MKTMKKIVGIMLALALVLSFTASALAAANITIVGTDKAPTTGHTYNVYQIYTGTLATDEDGVETLSNIKYGKNYTPGTTKVGDAVPASEIEALADPVAFVESISLEGAAVAVLSEENNWSTKNIEGLELPEGYYYVFDTAGDDTASAYIVRVLGDITMAPKSTGTTLTKQVGDINDSLEDAEIIWGDSADHDFGDDVPFVITVDLEANVELYDAYKLIINDEMSKGLVYNNDAVVKIDGVAVTSGYTVDYAATGINGESFLTITFEDVVALGAKNSSVVTVEYTAELTEDAVIGEDGNLNEAYAEFSNNPNTDSMGTTETDVNVVFTFQTIVNKVDGNFQPLAGAEFKLYKFFTVLPEGATDYEVVKDSAGVSTLGYWVALDAAVVSEGTEFAFKGLDDGQYKLVETTTPVGYNTIEPVEFTVTAEHTIEGISSLTGTGAVELEFTATATTGTLETDIVNNKGVQLPETGGIGTTIFYIVGGVLVLAAVVLLVTKKRMKNQ